MPTKRQWSKAFRRVEIEELRADNERLREENERLRKRVADLEGRNEFMPGLTRVK